MISEEREEKIIKSLGIVTLLCILPMMVLLKDNVLKSCIIIPLAILSSILYYRKYTRDKRDGKDVSRFKRMFFFMVISIVITVVFILLPNLK
jgi:MFS superfamily sulfate permease-like transporter